MAKDTEDKLSYIQEKIDDVDSCVKNIDKELALQKAAFDDHLKQDERMYEEFKRMNDILQQNTDSLKEHMHRTELLESLVQKMDVRLSPLEIQNIEAQAIKAYRNSAIVKFAKIVGIVAGLVGVIATIWPLFKH